MMCIQNLVSFCQFVLKKLSKNQILPSIRGPNPVANFKKTTIYVTNVDLVAGSVVEHPLRDREVVGSIPGRAIPKALKMVPVATLLGAQHYKASTGYSSPNKNIAQLTSQHLQK